MAENNIPLEISRAMKIAENTNYRNINLEYIRNVSITEWDIKSAGFNVLKFRKLVPESLIKELEKMDKHVRTIKEGYMQRSNPKIAEEIINTLAKVRKAFVLANRIPDTSILSIKKDAIFLINETPSTTTIVEYFKFRKKGVYTSYLSIGNKEFYYNGLTNTLDCKGILEESKKLQKDYILKDIQSILRSAEKVGPFQLYISLKTYRERYLNRKLPLETYRELDSGKFRIGEYLTDSASEDMRDSIDISQNYLSYILPIINRIL